MDRSLDKVKTQYGSVGVKTARYNDFIKIYPEYEDCKKVALENDLTLNEVYDLVKKSHTL